MAEATVESATDKAADSAEAQAVSPENGDYWKSEAKKAFAERQALKERLRTLEEKEQAEAKKRLEETQSYKQELEKIMPEFETLKKFRSEYDLKVQAKLEESEKALPADHRQEYEKFISKLDAETRIEWLSNRIGGPKPTPSSPAANRTGDVKGAKPANAMTFEERIALAKTDPEAFKKLI